MNEWMNEWMNMNMDMNMNKRMFAFISRPWNPRIKSRGLLSVITKQTASLMCTLKLSSGASNGRNCSKYDWKFIPHRRPGDGESLPAKLYPYTRHIKGTERGSTITVGRRYLKTKSAWVSRRSLMFRSYGADRQLRMRHYSTSRVVKTWFVLAQ